MVCTVNTKHLFQPQRVNLPFVTLITTLGKWCYQSSFHPNMELIIALRRILDLKLELLRTLFKESQISAQNALLPPLQLILAPFFLVHFCPSDEPMKLFWPQFRRGKYALKIALYFTHQNGPTFGVKPQIF